MSTAFDAEQQRLNEHYAGQKNWLRWGPYLSERQWGTVREDYSPDGEAWRYFPHDHARSRVYRWGEDGLAGICDDQCNLCFGLALWNERDPFLKERLFGLAGHEGNHAEDVKELYYYLDSTPTHSYMRQLYKYPQRTFPYEQLLQESRRRSKLQPEYELLDTGIFDDNRYFDVFTEYAKAGPDDILIRITTHNRSPQPAELTVLPTLWFRNRWAFEPGTEKPTIHLEDQFDSYSQALAFHPGLGPYYFYFENPERVLFTENETNTERLFGVRNEQPFVKDSFHYAVTRNDFEWMSFRKWGTKCAPLYRIQLQAGGKSCIRLRLCKEKKSALPFTVEFDKHFESRKSESDLFYQKLGPSGSNSEIIQVQKQAFAGLLWSKQYYNYDIEHWLQGDPGQFPPPESRKKGRNTTWQHLNNEDILSMPDKWEYPWYAAWDLAFHCVPLAVVDPQFAKDQLILVLREWYMHPNGQIPAYEWNFSDVNPPVHAWAALKVYEIDRQKNGKGDLSFLKRVFQKLLLNFTWWVNRKDHNDNNVFEGGFLGLDNIGLFDRSKEVPGGGILEQADGTAWMAMYCLNMLSMALEIAAEDPDFEDVATKFLEHFIYITEALHHLHKDWTGAWDQDEGFFYDILALPDGRYFPLRIRSLVGLSTLFAATIIRKEQMEKLPDFRKRLAWFRTYRRKRNKYLVIEEFSDGKDLLLSLVSRTRLEQLLKALLDEREFLSPGGIRSVSKLHETPYVINLDGQTFSFQYDPGESSTWMFGGNSNWRGPVWLPANYMLIESLLTYHRYYGEGLKVAYPTGSNHFINLESAAKAIAQRNIDLFMPGSDGQRPVHGDYFKYRDDPHFRDLILFYEYFHADNGRGVGASHQTGWTALVAELIWRETVDGRRGTGIGLPRRRRGNQK